jgi:hypothetical protein
VTPAERVARTVRDRLDELARRDYGWDRDGGLPMRDDARRLALELCLAIQAGPVLDGADPDRTAVELLGDGTIEVSLVNVRGDIAVALHLPCASVVNYQVGYRGDDDDATGTTEGTIRLPAGDHAPGDFTAVEAVLAALSGPEAP